MNFDLYMVLVGSYACFFLIGMAGGYYYYENYEVDETISFEDQYAGEFENYALDCTNLSLVETALCLRENVSAIFSYNITPDDWDLTYEELVTRGGDCRDWAFYYEQIMPEGFYGRTFGFEYTNETAHRFFVLSNDEGYCILDQLAPIRCNRLGTIKKENITATPSQNITFVNQTL